LWIRIAAEAAVGKTRVAATTRATVLFMGSPSNALDGTRAGEGSKSGGKALSAPLLEDLTPTLLNFGVPNVGRSRLGPKTLFATGTLPLGPTLLTVECWGFSFPHVEQTFNLS
jgi:hypothetical protein